MAITNYSNRIQQIVTSYKVDFKIQLTSQNGFGKARFASTYIIIWLYF